MALSNKFGWLVLTTGNKSEMSVGYSTLYGDSAGGFAVIKDVPEDARLPARGRARAARPASRRCPSRSSRARRRPSCAPTSATQDSLPPYEVLDAILEGYVEQDLGREQLIARGLPAGRRRPRHPPRRPRRVQAPPEPAGDQGHLARRSGATGACRSPTATADDRARHRRREPARDRRRVRARAGRARGDGGLHRDAGRDGARRPAGHRLHDRPVRGGRARAADGRGHRADRAPERARQQRRVLDARRLRGARRGDDRRPLRRQRARPDAAQRAAGARGAPGADRQPRSPASSSGPMPGELAYTASKGALEAFTRQLAAEVAHLGITVNAVGPGPQRHRLDRRRPARASCCRASPWAASGARRTPRRWWPGCARRRPAGSPGR